MMIPDNVRPVLINGDGLEQILFKCAIHYAELGLNIWFISPQQFNQLPENVEPPDREILKLITFLYLKDQKDLVTHLNGIHLWHRCPKVIILNGYEHYCRFAMDYDAVNAAFVTASLLDATSACARKHNSEKTFLLASCNGSSNAQLNVLTDMYFPHSLSCQGQSASDLLSYIQKCFAD